MPPGASIVWNASSIIRTPGGRVILSWSLANCTPNSASVPASLAVLSHKYGRELLHHTYDQYRGVDMLCPALRVLLYHVGEHGGCIALGTTVCRQENSHGPDCHGIP